MEINGVSYDIWVALRKESVDRNVGSSAAEVNYYAVALRKESVDRNVNLRVLDGSNSVALRKESVDRNIRIMSVLNGLSTSLSVRRAWIEMSIEEVSKYVVKESLSVRRAWIEI